MVIIIDEVNYDVKKVKEALENNNIEHSILDNVYWAVCKEEIMNTIDCSTKFHDVVSNEDVDGIIYDLTDELYNARETNNAFQELAETAELIVNRKIYNMEVK